LTLFVTSISLFGLRRGTARDLSALDEPHSILSANVEFRADELGSDVLVIGTYDEDHSLITMRLASATVTCTTPDGMKVRATWPDLGTFIRDEVSRLHTLLAPGFAGLCLGTFTRKVPGDVLKGDLTEADFSRPWWRFW
jgi:hypothetical protein